VTPASWGPTDLAPLDRPGTTEPRNAEMTLVSYVEEIVADLEALLPWGPIDDDERRTLSCFYAALFLTKGPTITTSDVHDAWAAAMTAMRREHPDVVPYGELDDRARSKDEPFAIALSQLGAASRRVGRGNDDD
jgi:hypothetical protein